MNTNDEVETVRLEGARVCTVLGNPDDLVLRMQADGEETNYQLSFEDLYLLTKSLIGDLKLLHGMRNTKAN